MDTVCSLSFDEIPQAPQSLLLDCADVKGILEDHVDQVHTQKPTSLCFFETTIPVKRYEQAEGVKDNEHGRKMEGIKVRWHR